MHLSKRANGKKISIHAPREGSDGRGQQTFLLRSYFYPRSPRGERRLHEPLFRLKDIISIHAPREGSDADPVLP